MAYVDDCMITDDATCDERLAAVSVVRELHEWRPWEHGSFTPCRVQIVQSCHQDRWSVREMHACECQLVVGRSNDLEPKMMSRRESRYYT